MDRLTALVLRSQSGDVAAFEALVARFEGMAVSYATSLLGDFHLAEDAAQEAFVSAYLELATLQEPRAFTVWFRRPIHRSLFNK